MTYNFPDYEKVLVVGGDDGSFLDDVELLALGGQSGNCDVLPDYPIAVKQMTGALLEGGSTVKVCGGYDGTSTRVSSCYDLSAGSGAWREAEPMMVGRFAPSSSVVGDKWFITGGDVSKYFTRNVNGCLVDTRSFLFFVSLLCDTRSVFQKEIKVMNVVECKREHDLRSHVG